MTSTRTRKFFDPSYLTNEECKIRKKKKTEYLNMPACFDIETSSFYEGKAKRACMYAFVFGVNGKVIFGREWKDLFNILKELQLAYNLSESRRLIVYVHNLGYEFQFFCKRFEWSYIFATDERRPACAVCQYGIEFRDSYILAGQGLEGVGKNLTKYKIDKLIGDLDYLKIRHSKTKLTADEWHYIENDGLVLMAFIQEEIEKNGNNITRIPLTKTGYARRYMKNQAYHAGQKGHGERRKNKTDDFLKYRKIMKRLQVTPEEYALWVDCFQGGFTHANAFNVGLTFENVASMDLTSAYPAEIVLGRNYPMSSGTKLEDLSKQSFMKHLQLYACVFRIHIYNLSSKMKGDHFISFHKCRNVRGYELDNGRIIDAEYLETVMTDVDFRTICKFYTFDRIEVSDFWYYSRGYLPRNFIKGVLGLYADKTTLKGIEGEEQNYVLKKELLNSTYGMICTRLDQAVNKYEDGVWSQEEPNILDTLKIYNESSNRFMFWIWAVFITANVRATIAKCIEELGSDYIYSDTDSVKFLNLEKHKAFFDDYNASIRHKIALSSEINALDDKLFMPKTKEGDEKPIGVFDYEGTYARFRALGAKRYFVEYPEPHKMRLPDGTDYETTYSLTVSGVNKRYAIPKIVAKAEKEGKDPFDYFVIGYEFTEEECGKQTHTYCDYEIKGIVTDYLGKRGKYNEKSFIHLAPTTYKMTTTEEYMQQIYLDQLDRKVRIDRRRKR